ncbi:hypothetical protein BDN72DRAFT_865206, partial [Pluteus cervinus]
MGRRAKYNTPGEKKAANRLKSQRSYWKNQDEINVRRRSRYQDDIRSLSSRTTVLGTDKTEREWRAVYTVNDVKTRFEHFVGQSRYEFVNSRLQKSFEYNNEDFLAATLSRVETFLEEAQRAESEVYGLDGASEEWRVAHTLTASIRTITQALEEVSCAFLTGIEYSSQRSWSVKLDLQCEKRERAYQLCINPVELPRIIAYHLKGGGLVTWRRVLNISAREGLAAAGCALVLWLLYHCVGSEAMGSRSRSSLDQSPSGQLGCSGWWEDDTERVLGIRGCGDAVGRRGGIDAFSFATGHAKVEEGRGRMGKDGDKKTQIPAFQEAQRKKTTKRFFANVKKTFLSRWPNPRNGVKARRAQVHNWFYNNRRNQGHKVRRLKAFVIGKIRRNLQPLEIYSQKYYKERVAPRVKAEAKRLHTPKKQCLQLIRRITREVFESETPEVKQEILTETEAQKKAGKGQAREKPTPADYAAGIESLPFLLKEIGEYILEATGWVSTIYVGGPDPLSGGKLDSMSCHTGKNGEKLTFNKAFDLTPFHGFWVDHIAECYPPEIRALYAFTSEEASLEEPPNFHAADNVEEGDGYEDEDEEEGSDEEQGDDEEGENESGDEGLNAGVADFDNLYRFSQTPAPRVQLDEAAALLPITHLPNVNLAQLEVDEPLLAAVLPRVSADHLFPHNAEEIIAATQYIPPPQPAPIAIGHFDNWGYPYGPSPTFEAPPAFYADPNDFRNTILPPPPGPSPSPPGSPASDAASVLPPALARRYRTSPPHNTSGTENANTAASQVTPAVIVALQDTTSANAAVPSTTTDGNSANNASGATQPTSPSTTPKNNAAAAPKKKTAIAPQKKTTTAPNKKTTTAPQNKTAAAPKKIIKSTSKATAAAQPTPSQANAEGNTTAKKGSTRKKTQSAVTPATPATVAETIAAATAQLTSMLAGDANAQDAATPAGPLTKRKRTAIEPEAPQDVQVREKRSRVASKPRGEVVPLTMQNKRKDPVAHVIGIMLTKTRNPLISIERTTWDKQRFDSGAIFGGREGGREGKRIRQEGRGSWQHARAVFRTSCMKGRAWRAQALIHSWPLELKAVAAQSTVDLFSTSGPPGSDCNDKAERGLHQHGVQPGVSSSGELPGANVEGDTLHSRFYHFVSLK